MNKRRLKVLLGCYACDPNFGSEPGMGWNFVSNIAKHHDVHAIVEEGEFKENLTRYSAEHPEDVKNITFHFVRRHHHNTLRKIWPPSYYWFYRVWHKRAYKLAVELNKKENFDLVHQVNLAGFREPGYLWKLNKPFIWGPLGGFTQTAWCLLPGMGLHALLYFSMRNILNLFQKRFNYAVRRAAKKAHTIFVSDSQGETDARNIWNRETVMMKEIATHPLPSYPPVALRQPATPLRICWVGELIPLKALDILIDALALCKHPMQVEVLGRGPKLQAWQSKCTALKLEHCVNFRGFVPHEQVTNIMSSCHVLCITSIKEGGTSTVVLEALQCGLPIIAIDHCGFASVINENCGIKIAVQPRQKIIRDFAEQLDFLYANEPTRLALAAGAQKRSEDFTWNANMKMLNKAYENACVSY